MPHVVVDGRELDGVAGLAQVVAALHVVDRLREQGAGGAMQGAGGAMGAAGAMGAGGAMGSRGVVC